MAMSWIRRAAVCVGLALASPALADIQVTFRDTPADGFIRGDFALRVAIVSTYEVTAVTAAYAGQSRPLSQDTPSDWSAIIQAAGLPTGPTTFTVTATDVFGNTGEGSLTLTPLRPPLVALESPALTSVARTGVRIAATCQSALGGSCTFRLDRLPNAGTWTTDGPSIDLTECLGDSRGQTIQYQLRALDTAYPVAKLLNLSVVVDDSTWYVEEERAPGDIVDWDSQRILFTDLDFDGGILDRSTRDVTGLETQARTCWSCGLSCSMCDSRGGLVPGGAVVVSKQDVVSVVAPAGPQVIGHLLDYSPGQPGGFWARGGSVLWGDCVSGILPNCPVGARRRFRDGGLELLDINGLSLGPGGELAYISNYRAFLEREEGVPEQIGFGTRDWAPATDGIDLIYGHDQGDGGAALILASRGTYRTILADTNSSHGTAGGWAVFTRPGPTGVPQLWEQAPDGGERQLTFWSSPSTVEAVAPDGTFLYQVDQERWLALPDGGGHRVGLALGKATWSNGWHLAMGDRIFGIAGEESALPACVAHYPGGDGPSGCSCGSAGGLSAALASLAVALAVGLARRRVRPARGRS